MKKSLFISLFICLLAITFFLNEPKISAESTNTRISPILVPIERVDAIKALINDIEYDLNENNTDVVTELTEYKSTCQELLETNSNDTENLEKLIEEIDEIVTEYNEYKLNENTRGTFHLTYSPAIAAIASGFLMSGWELSAELLLHARSNNDINSEYYPTFAKNIAFTKIFTNLVNDNTISGSKMFDGPNFLNFTKYDEDAYFSIHWFKYQKMYYSEGKINIKINDRYDYNEDTGNGLQAKLVNLCYEAQVAGVLVPYFTVIDLISEGNIPFKYTINGDNITIDGYLGDNVNVEIPSEIENHNIFYMPNEVFQKYTVSSISQNAFQNSNINSIILPDTITSIDSSSFENCLNLKSVTLSNNLTSIGSSAFKNCNKLQSIVIPDNVVNIGPNAFENCTSLVSVSLSNNLGFIGMNAFDGCSSLTSMNIPSSVTYIDSFAFKDCNSLTEVKINREKNLTYIGKEVFNGCTSLDKITIPISKIFRYRNDANWSTYVNLLKIAGSVSKYNFHCRTSKMSFDSILEGGGTLVYMLNIECPIQYRIDSESSSGLVMNIYDENMNFVASGVTSEYNGTHMAFFVPSLSVGKYYVEVYYDNESNTGTILNEITPHTSTKEYITDDGKVNVLTHLHENKNEFIISPKTSGLISLEIKTTTNNNDPVVNPESEIEIKDTSGNIVQKMSLSEYNHPAVSISNANNIMFYANERESYTVYLKVADIKYQKLILEVKKIEEFTSYDMDEEDKYISNKNISIGDFAYIYNLERIGTYNILFDYQGIQADKMLFVLFETNENGEYVYKSAYEINSATNYIEYIDEVTYSKKILLCVFDSQGKGEININIVKELNSDFTIYASSQPNATKINLTKGYQEICYLGSNAPNTSSRYTYYNWYSTNEDVAIVSAYGTVTAVGVGKAKIQCVYKLDTSQVGTLELEVFADPLDNNDEAHYVYLNYGMDVRVGGTTTGTEVSVLKKNTIPVSKSPYVSIHIDYTRLICLGEDSPNSSVQAFNWRAYKEFDTDTGMVNVSQFGTITGKNVGWVTVEGTYKYNNRFRVKIRIYVEP